MAKTKSWVLTAPKTMEYREYDIPAVGPEDMLLEVKATCICGSDPHRYLNDDGKAPYPLILGHEYAGIVKEIGEKAAGLYHVEVGDHVTVEPYIPCGHCEYCLNGHYNLCEENQVYGWSASMMETVEPRINENISLFVMAQKYINLSQESRSKRVRYLRLLAMGIE